MMLTSPFFMPPQQQYYSAYMPPNSSPLSERSPNAAPRLFSFNMPSPPPEKQSPTPKRVHKPNPVMQTRDAATKRRRDMFFRRVQTGREDKKWEARGEQIQQLDFVSERKRWEAEKARQAPPEDDNMIEEIPEDATPREWSNKSPQHQPEMTEADYIAAQEEYELQQLIASMEHENDNASQHFGSDDEDYDELFMECVTTGDQQQHELSSFGFGGGDSMDMDMTDG